MTAKLVPSLLAVALLALAAAPASAADEVKVGINGLISDSPFFIADEQGFFKEEGIEVKFIHFDAGPKMVAPLGTGDLDAAAGAASAGLFNAAARGIAIKIVADKGSTPPGPSYMPLIVRKDLVDSGRVKKVADVKGLKIAVAGQGGSPESTLNEVLKKSGLTFADVTLVQNIGYPQQVAQLQQKQIDGAITAEPATTQAVETGAAVRFSTGADYPNQEVAVLLYGGNFIAKRRAVAERFMVAYVRAIRVFNDAIVDGHFTGKTAAAVIDVATRDGTFKDKSLFPKMIANGCNPDGRLDMATLRNDFDFYKARGYIEGAITADAVVDNSFVDFAVAKLGPYKRDK